MKSQIICPTCKTPINLNDVLTEDVEKEIRQQYEAQNQEIINQFNQRNLELNKLEAEFELKKKKENEIFADKLSKELEKATKLKEEEIIKKIANESKVKIDFLEKQNEENTNKLKSLHEKEFEVLNLQKLLQEQREQEEFKLKKQRIELENDLKEKIATDIIAKEKEKFDLEKRELEKQLNDQKKLTQEMIRKHEQGSMQMQGEVQEIFIEELLAQSFPFDKVDEVGKGRRGADCILTIRNEIGAACGKIIFESKRTKEFKKEWLVKLKEDALDSGADINVLITQTMPDGMQHFDQRDGVWICKMSEVIQIVKVLREGLINVYRANKSQENKGEKKEMLYNYFTSNEFMQQMRAINEAYMYLKSSIDREKSQMEKLWKEREKQIDKVLLNNSHLIGSIRGIAGDDVNDLNLLE